LKSYFWHGICGDECPEHRNPIERSAIVMVTHFDHAGHLDNRKRRSR